MRFFVYVTLIAALLVSFVPAQAMLASTVVEPANPNGWVVIDDNGKGSGMGDFVTGPATPPLGTGSAHLVLSKSDAGWVFARAMEAGTQFSDLTKLEYSTFVTVNGGAQAVSLQIAVDYDTTDDVTGFQGRLSYEPYMNLDLDSETNNEVKKGVWQTWNAMDPDAKWFGTRDHLKTVCPMEKPCTWAYLKATYPNMAFHPVSGAVYFKAGSGWANFDGNFDKFVIGVNGVETTYDFEPTTTGKASTVYVDDNFILGVNPVTQAVIPLPLYTDPDGIGPAKSMGYDASYTVQGGVDLVASGGTVNIAEGTYTEQVLVNNLDGITIEGAGEALVTIKAIPDLVSILDADRKPVLGVANSDDVTVKNLTLDGNGTGNTNNRLFGLFFLNSSGLIDHVTAKAMRHTPLDGTQGGVGIYVYNTDTVARTVTATNNTAIDYQKGGLVFNGEGLTAVVDKNTATGIGATPVIAMNGIQIGYGANATVTRNTVTGHSYINPPNPTTEWTAAGILLYDATAEISSNVIPSNQVGISSYKSDFTASRNYISGGVIGEYGIAQDGGTSTITANNITSNDYGIDVSTSESTTVGGRYTANSTIRNNRFFNNDVGVANEIFSYPDQEAPVLDALNNWWSCNEGPTLVAGDCDSKLGPVNTDTWLILTLTADKTHVLDGSPATLTGSITQNNENVVVTEPVLFPDGKSVEFSTTYPLGLVDGLNTAVEKDLVGGSATSVFTVSPWANYETATVKVKLDNETVTLDLLAGLRHLWLPTIFGK